MPLAFQVNGPHGIMAWAPDSGTVRLHGGISDEDQAGIRRQVEEHLRSFAATHARLIRLLGASRDTTQSDSEVLFQTHTSQGTIE